MTDTEPRALPFDFLSPDFEPWYISRTAQIWFWGERHLRATRWWEWRKRRRIREERADLLREALGPFYSPNEDYGKVIKGDTQ